MNWDDFPLYKISDMKDDIKSFITEHSRELWFGYDKDHMCALMDKFFDELEKQKELEIQKKAQYFSELGHKINGNPTSEESWCTQCGMGCWLIEKENCKCPDDHFLK